MDCREFLQRYSEYDDSLIPPAEADRFRAHMAVCASCTRYDRVLRKGRMVARQLTDPEPSDDFLPRLQLRLRRERRAVERRRPLARGAAVAAGLAAATVLMAAAMAVPLMGPGASTGGPARAAGAYEAPGSVASPAYRMARVEVARMGSFRLEASALPAQERVSPRAWPVKEVAPADAATYSPLETGPPAYRPASRTFTVTDRALD